VESRAGSPSRGAHSKYPIRRAYQEGACFKKSLFREGLVQERLVRERLVQERVCLRKAWRLCRELLVLRLGRQGFVGFGVVDDFAQ